MTQPPEPGGLGAADGARPARPGLFGWLDERLGLTEIWRGLFDRAVPDRLTLWHTLGSATLTIFLVQLVTGVVLATFYAASPDHAYESVRHLEQQVTAGAFLRAVHNWGSSFMVVLVLAHTIRVFTMGAYKYPREINWVLGIAMLALVFGFGFTGYLLPWDQRAYWATQVGTNMAGTTPIIGAFLTKTLRAGSQLGAGTLTRFYSFHVLWLPISLFALIALHMTFIIRQGIASLPKTLEDGAPARTSDPAYGPYYKVRYAAAKSGRTRFFPHIVGKDVAVAVGVVLLLFLLAAAFGAPLEAPADPSDSAYTPRPEWYFLPLYEMLKLVPGSMEAIVAVGVPALLGLVLLGLPFYDRNSTRSFRGRPVAMLGLTAVLGGAALMLGRSFQDVQPANAAETSVVLGSMERAGRGLFRRQCQSCHVVAGKGGDKGPDLGEIGARHSVGWLHSFIEEPSRFHPETEMLGFGPPVMTHQEIEEVSRYLSTLRGPPEDPIAPVISDTFPERPTPLKSNDPTGGP